MQPLPPPGVQPPPSIAPGGMPLPASGMREGAQAQ
jgi:hypothetical protein